MKVFKKVILGGILLLSTAYSCTDNFDALNTNPSLVNKDIVDPDILFTSAQRDYIYSIPSLGIMQEYAGYYASQASGNLFLNRNWDWPYDDYLINNEEVIRLTEDAPLSANKNAIARIWKVALFHPVTDDFGDVPYTEALKDVEESISQPVYDTQQSIYENMLNELRDAAATLDNSEDLGSFGAADLIYGGDVEMWERYANSLRLRLAIRVRYADENLASEHISDVIGAPLLEDNSHNPSFTTEGEDAVQDRNRNPIYNSYLTRGQPAWANHTITYSMNARNDPRLPVYFNEAEDGVSGYNGRPIQLQGEDQSGVYTPNNSAHLGDYFTTAEFTINLMHYAEVEFLKAEAYLTGLASGNAQAAFEEGIRASMEYYNVDEADIANYLMTEGTLSADEEGALEEIIVQKFIANFLLADEAWTEYRRTGYPLMYFGSEEGVTDGKLPRRKTYPELEYSVNESNLQQAISRLNGGDELLSRIWWDAKSGLPYEHPEQGTFPPSK